MNTLLINHPVFRALISLMHTNKLGTDMNLNPETESSELFQFDVMFIWILKSPFLLLRPMLQAIEQSTIISQVSTKYGIGHS